jgi:succinate dehydrogenase / fumarate reductase membrane anchor subunit
VQARLPARPRPAETSGRGPANNLELYAWFFTRVSAIVLFLMALFHLVYMHLILGVDTINFEVIAQRWESPFWRLYDLFLLAFGWLHGANGMRIILDDYVHPQGWRVIAKTALYLMVAVIIVLGAYVILTFRP